MKISIRYKILFVTAPCFLSLFVVFALQKQALSRQSESSQYMKDVHAPLSTAIYRLKSAFAQDVANITDMAYQRLSLSEARETNDVLEMIIKVNSEIIFKHPAVVGETAVKELQNILRSEIKISEEIFQLYQQKKTAQAQKSLSKFSELAQAMNLHIEVIHENIIKKQTAFMEQLTQTQEQNLQNFTYLFIGSVLLSLVLASIISHFIVAPISHLQSIFENVGQGHQSVRATVNTKDELQTLATGFNSMIENLTSVQMQLVRSAKLSSLGEMAGGIAHEINNPLTVISGVVQRLRKLNLQGSITQEQLNRDLERLDSTTLRITKIIKGLKGLSRDADHDPLEHSHLRKIIDECLELLRDRYLSNNTDLRVHCPEDILISCRPSQIFQVLMNLLGNAHDAIEKLEERWVQLDVMTSPLDHRKIWIQVMDSGPGIPEETLNRLMTPFFTTKPAGKGTGLGLSISRKIAESHGGVLFYRKDQGHTCFVLELPSVVAETLAA